MEVVSHDFSLKTSLGFASLGNPNYPPKLNKNYQKRLYFEVWVKFGSKLQNPNLPTPLKLNSCKPYSLPNQVWVLPLSLRERDPPFGEGCLLPDPVTHQKEEILMRTTPRTSLERHQPHSSLSEEEIDRMRRAAWQKQGVLNVAPSDRRLTWPEREFIKQIGEKLYGSKGEQQ